MNKGNRSCHKALTKKSQSFLFYKEKLFLALFFTLCIIFWELSVHFLTLGGFNREIVFPVIFAIPSGCAVALLCSLFGRVVNKISVHIATVLLTLIYASQYIYHCIFGSFFSVSQIGMGGDAITGFWDETLSYIKANIMQLIWLFLPLVLFEVLFIARRFHMTRIKIGRAAGLACIIMFVQLLCLSALFIDSGSLLSYREIYFSNSTDTDRSVEALGVLTTGRLELTHMLLGSEKNELSDMDIASEITTPEDAQSTEENAFSAPAKQYNIIKKIDFDKLNDCTDSESISILNNYFAKQTGTAKNDYTGLFEGYNLITICAESFSPYLINEQLTPTLYKLSHEGIVFNNFYNSYLNNTTNGEYTMCMGIFPDLSRSKSNGSFSNSRNNYLPFCLGNVFQSAGVQSYAYHNYIGGYYNRENSHPNMGYIFKSADNGMKFSTSWPASDLEMMEQSVDEYIHKERFHAYYMSFSGHLPYTFEENPMSWRNRKYIKGSKYAEPVNAYIACNQELEKALCYLVNRLQEEGVADKTVIVLSNDHYPYGLTTPEFAQLSGIKRPTRFDKCKSSFICWTSGLAQPIINDEYCCTVDILPTLLNLFGFDFDSRLLTGTDIFSDSPHIAVLNDRSFITDLVKFDSGTGKVSYFDAADQYPTSYVESYVSSAINTIKNRMTVSAAILNNDYYRFVYENSKLK